MCSSDLTLFSAVDPRAYFWLLCSAPVAFFLMVLRAIFSPTGLVPLHTFHCRLVGCNRRDCSGVIAVGQEVLHFLQTHSDAGTIVHIVHAFHRSRSAMNFWALRKVLP